MTVTPSIPTADVAKLFMTFFNHILEGVLGLGRQDVKDALLSLDESGKLKSAREKHRQQVNSLIDRVFGCTREDLLELGQQTDPMLLALILDRVYAATEALGKAIHRMPQLPGDNPPQFDQVFQMLLKQDFGS